jgi:hypothetical protein
MAFKRNNPGCPCCGCVLQRDFTRWEAETGAWTLDDEYGGTDGPGILASRILPSGPRYRVASVRFGWTNDLQQGQVVKIGLRHGSDRLFAAFSLTLDRENLTIDVCQQVGDDTTVLASATIDYDGLSRWPIYVSLHYDPERDRFSGGVYATGNEWAHWQVDSTLDVRQWYLDVDPDNAYVVEFFSPVLSECQYFSAETISQRGLVTKGSIRFRATLTGAVPGESRPPLDDTVDLYYSAYSPSNVSNAYGDAPWINRTSTGLFLAAVIKRDGADLLLQCELPAFENGGSQATWQLRLVDQADTALDIRDVDETLPFLSQGAGNADDFSASSVRLEVMP